MATDLVKELSLIERLKLALEYSASEKHKKSLLEKIAKIEGKKEAAVKESQVSLF